MSNKKISTLVLLGALVAAFFSSAERPVSSVGFTGGRADTGGGGGTPITVTVTTPTPVSGIYWNSNGYYSSNNFGYNGLIRFEAAPNPLFSGAVYHWTFTCVNNSNNITWHWYNFDGAPVATGWVDHAGKITAQCTVSYGSNSGSGTCVAYAIGGPISLVSNHNPSRDINAISPTSPNSTPVYLDYYQDGSTTPNKAMVTASMLAYPEQPPGTTYQWHYTNLLGVPTGYLATNITCNFWALGPSTSRGDGAIWLTYSLNGFSYDDCNIDRHGVGIADAGYRTVTCHMPANVVSVSATDQTTTGVINGAGYEYDMALYDCIGDPMPNTWVTDRYPLGEPTYSVLGHPVQLAVKKVAVTGQYGPPDVGFTANGRFMSPISIIGLSGDDDYVGYQQQYFGGTNSHDMAHGGVPLTKYHCRVGTLTTNHYPFGVGDAGPEEWLLFVYFHCV